MLVFNPKLFGDFTVNDVYDPEELGADSRVSQRFPSFASYNTYRMHKRVSNHRRSNNLLSRFAIKRMGALTIGLVESRFAMDVGIAGEGMQRLFLTFTRGGSIAMQTSQKDEAVSHQTKGLVYRGLPGTQMSTTDDSSRITVQIEESRLNRTLTSLLDEPYSECPHFEPLVDWTTSSCAPIARTVQRIIDELGDPTGLCSVAAAFESYTDSLVHLILANLPHSQSERLHTPCSPAIPRQLRRAEEFMEAHAGQPISIADIATAAGCGARALQLAFRRFRDTTPLAALQEVRLRAIRDALATTNDPAVVIARRFGFSNGTRFRAAFRHRFGDLPRQQK